MISFSSLPECSGTIIVTPIAIATANPIHSSTIALVGGLLATACYILA
jgi:hypothetical protein